MFMMCDLSESPRVGGSCQPWRPAQPNPCAVHLPGVIPSRAPHSAGSWLGSAPSVTQKPLKLCEKSTVTSAVLCLLPCSYFVIFGGIPPPNALPKGRKRVVPYTKVQISSCWHSPAALALAASIWGDNTGFPVWESFHGVYFPHCWQIVSQMCTQFRATTSY